MPAMQVTVFGGSGFLGRRIVAALLARDVAVRVAVRRPDRVWEHMQETAEGAGGLTAMRADIGDAATVAAAVAGSQGVVNAVSLYAEGRGVSFRDIHVDGARRVAEAARREGVARLLHLSGIGADAAARSPYVRSRGEGEVAVRQEFEQAVIFRPSVMVGPDDALLSGLAALIGRLPVLPLFGRGETRLQPVFVGDVAEAAARALTSGQPPAPLYELGGPDIVSYRQLIGLVARRSGCRPLLLPVPFPLWGGITMLAGLLPSPPLTEGQVALMKRDNVAAPALPGLAELGVAPTPLAAVLERGVDAG